MFRTRQIAIAAVMGGTMSCFLVTSSGALPAAAATAPYIVRGASAAAARAQLADFGVTASRDLALINAVGAELTATQAERLRRDPQLRVYADRHVATQGSLLQSLTLKLDTSVKTLTNNTNNLLARSVVGDVTATASKSVVAPVLSLEAVRLVSAPLVGASSQGAALDDGKGVAAAGLLYQTSFPALVGADKLQDAGVTGSGVTIAVLDTGLWRDAAQNYGSRILATVDVVNGARRSVQGDPFGHGTHVTSIAASGAISLAGRAQGVAPDANLVVVRAFNEYGAGAYSDVIAGLDWVVANKDRYRIRVLNLSFGASPQSFYWDDPLNQAVMAAWRAGIVVVVSAGNDGPQPMTINVPGNVPYVITVGALTDNYTPYNGNDDRLASFSSAGPTYEGFVKPEVLAPGGHIAASMSSSSYLANLDPGSMQLGQQLFTMSGTSQAAAVTTGVVALMLQKDPLLTPDQVKCRLIASARPALSTSGKLAYSVFQQGAGLINAAEAAKSKAASCANSGLDIDADLNGTVHFGGPANLDDNGNYYVMDMQGSGWADPAQADGYSWSKSYPWGQGYTWSNGYSWSKGYSWSRGYSWSKGYSWSRGYSWSKGYSWSRGVSWWKNASEPDTSAPASIASWVPNE